MGKGLFVGGIVRTIMSIAMIIALVPIGGVAAVVEEALDISGISIPGYHDIRPGEGVTEIKLLSDYWGSLKGTNCDTQVFVLEGEEDGPTALILGGTHGNENAGISAAILMIERAEVSAGKLIIIPVANYSASTNTDMMRPDISEFSVLTPSGERTWRYGGRRTNPKDQAETSEPFIPYEGQVLPSYEAANLNRVYPGSPDGNLTQQVGYAIMQILEVENVDIAVDMHEAGPSHWLSYTLIANPNVANIAAYATLFCCPDYGFDMKMDLSAADSIGLSHREWGDRTDVAAFLIETPNPGQEMDPSYGKMDVVNDPVHPLGERVGVHVYTIMSIFEAYDAIRGGMIVVNNLPTYHELLENGIGAYLN